ncbi:hypothetical protein KIPB_004163 [Kipferlia bialata]|uniref:Ankyrin repeat-containing domain-containing protein n=1 Tax=Kipferlia bialata TaxID=797122 RepID=A0A9K3GHK0_9EUKA|nr:hypothetical protein KIPB_004163 [Kipferlia bialata]|eukprot:g4163.t1
MEAKPITIRVRTEKGQTRVVVPSDATMKVFCKEGHASVVSLLLRREAIRKNQKGNSALMGAAQQGHAECVQMLVPLEMGLRNQMGQTALHHAALGGSVQCARLLMSEAGAQDRMGRCALHFACLSGSWQVARECVGIEHGLLTKAGLSSLHILMRRPTPDIPDDVFRSVFDLHSHTDNEGRTALMMAAANPGLASTPPHSPTADQLRMLCDHEAGKQDSRGMCALHHAAISGGVLVAGFVVIRELELIDKDGHDALYHSARNHNPGVMRVLIAKGRALLPQVVLRDSINRAQKHARGECADLLMEAL